MVGLPVEVCQKVRKARVNFAKDYLHWSPDDWSKVVFTDESKFNLIASDDIVYIRCRITEK